MKIDHTARQRLALPLIAAFAFLWILARAAVQSMTIDEADSFLFWDTGPGPDHWRPSSNNHVLNSALTRLFSSIFGMSHLSVRAPAIIGAVVYIIAAYALCRLLTRRRLMQCALFVCFVYNPFVLDHLVAARGYSLAAAFFMAAIAIIAHAHIRHSRGEEVSFAQACAWSSVCAALSFAANFSFAFANAVLMLGVLAWSLRHGVRPDPALGVKPERAGHIIAASILPGLIVSVFLSLSVVLEWPKGEFTFGATSMRETLLSVIESSLYCVNPHILTPLLYAQVHSWRLVVVFLLGAAVVCQVALVCWNLRRLGDRVMRRIAEMGLIAVCVAVVTLLAHWILFKGAGILLPKDRTALYLIPLCMTLITAAAVIEAPSRWAAASRRGMLVAVCVTATYFLVCMRSGHFKEWVWNADAKYVYHIVEYYHRVHGIKDVPVHWKWVAALNFYREMYHGDGIAKFERSDPNYPDGRGLYVMDYRSDEPIIRQRGWHAVYTGPLSAVAVAVNPGASGRQEAVVGSVKAEVRNLSRPGAKDFFVGDAFEVIVNGPAGREVKVLASQNMAEPAPASYGFAGVDGRFMLKGKMAPEHIGNWREVWSAGGANAAPVQFRVVPRAAPVPRNE